MPTKKAPSDRLIQIFDTFSPATVKYKDIFDMKEFYTALKFWLHEYGWTDDFKNSPSNEWFEKYYSERHTGSVKEVRIWWRLAKQAPGSTKLKYYIDMNFHCIALGSAEIIRDGQKIKTNKAEVELKIFGSIEKLYEKEFEEDKLLGMIKSFFTKRIYDGYLSESKKELYQEIYVLQNFIKQWFKLKRYLPYEEAKSFHPSQAWPSHLKS